MRLLREFILRTLNEDKKDVNDLVSINARFLKKQGFDGTPRELQSNARKGPIFDERTLAFIAKLTHNEIPHSNRKVYIKWIAEKHMKGELDVFYTNGDLTEDFVQYELGHIVDWINENPDEYLGMLESPFEQVSFAAWAWHDGLKANDDISIASADENVVYTWPDGWRIVNVPSSDCSAEGEAMGHCVGGYGERVERGQTVIFSLRDPKDKPHVTIQLEPVYDIIVDGDEYEEKIVEYELLQVKGKQNVPPKPEYARRVYEWLKQANVPNFHRAEDFIEAFIKPGGGPIEGLEDIYKELYNKRNKQ